MTQDHLKTWYCYFVGHYPVGAVLTVTARTEEDAVILAEKELKDAGLPQAVSKIQLRLLNTTERGAQILLDGDY